MNSSIALKVVEAQTDLGNPKIPVEIPGIEIDTQFNSFASLKVFFIVA